MAKLVEYTVAREHQGDKITDDGTEVHRFLEGETRLANPAIVAPLVKSGVLIAPDTEKSDEAREDKSEGDSEENRAEARKPARSKASK